MQKTFRGHRLRKEIESELTQKEKDLQNTENSVYGAKKNLNQKYGYNLRNLRENELGKVRQIVYSPISKGAKQKSIEPSRKKLDLLRDVIEPTTTVVKRFSRGAKPKA